jgi:hypothetical protein
MSEVTRILSAIDQGDPAGSKAIRTCRTISASTASVVSDWHGGAPKHWVFR